MEVVKSLETLDLSRNGITTIPPGTFRDLFNLKYLDLSLNSLRTVSAKSPFEKCDLFSNIRNLLKKISKFSNLTIFCCIEKLLRFQKKKIYEKF